MHHGLGNALVLALQFPNLGLEVVRGTHRYFCASVSVLSSHGGLSPDLNLLASLFFYFPEVLTARDEQYPVQGRRLCLGCFLDQLLA
jgi:hypothetical protein